MSKSQKLINILLSSLYICLLVTQCSCVLPKDDNQFLSLMHLLPATVNKDKGFVLINYKKIWKNNEIIFSKKDLDKVDLFSTVFEKIKGATNPDSYALLFGSYYTGWGGGTYWKFDRARDNPGMETLIQYKYVGYDIANIDAEINNDIGRFFDWGLAGSSITSTTAAIGNFVIQDIYNKFNARTGWPEWSTNGYLSDTYKNTLTFSWESDSGTNSLLDYYPVISAQNGGLLPLGINSTTLLTGDTLSELKTMIDASLNNTSSLADIPEYASVAKGLNELGAYVAIIGNDILANGPQTNRDIEKLKHFSTFGTGYGKDEKGTYITLVLIHENVNDASGNVQILKRHIEQYNIDIQNSTSRLPINETQISTKGKNLYAKLYTNDPAYWYYWLTSGDELLYHE
jgi:hypothetical protein